MSTFGAYAGALPFRDGWGASDRPAADALWDWHNSLKTPSAPALDGEDLHDYFLYQSQLAGRGEPVEVVPEGVWKAAYTHINANDLRFADLAAQVESAEVYRWNSLRFQTYLELEDLIDKSAVSHCRLLATLAGVRHTFFDSAIRSIGRGYFLLYHLVFLKTDAMANRVYIPVSELDQAGATVADVLQGNLDESLQKVLWRIIVRTRDAFAGGGALVDGLSRKRARALRTSIHASLEVLNKIERLEFDVWTQPVTLSRFHRAQAWYQARFSRVALY